jgi:hypothetical protein
VAHLIPDKRELTATLVVYGAARAGKTTVLHCINDRVAPDRRGPVDPFGAGLAVAPLLDWLPLDLGTISGWRTRVHLYAVPGHRQADATRRLLLADADGVLFVADSQAEALPATKDALTALGENLLTHGGRPRDLPTVCLFTKRDLPEELLLTPEAMAEALNLGDARWFACDARHGIGVLEGLHAAVSLVMRRLAPARAVAP